MPTPKVPTDPALWKRITKKHRDSSEGGKPGRWSARKAAMSQLEYKKQGGGWKKISAPSKTK